MKLLLRILIYLFGTASLAFGVVLNIKTGYGVASISSVPYSISIITGISLGNITMLVSCIYIILQGIIMRNRFTTKILLQIPYSILFGMLTDLFNNTITLTLTNCFSRTIVLFLALFFTSVGVMLAINMMLVINPADGLTQEIGIVLNKDFGFAKNLYDGFCVLFTSTISLIFTGRIIGIGIGTVMSAICIGRMIAFLNRRFKDKLQRITGVQHI